MTASEIFESILLKNGPDKSEYHALNGICCGDSEILHQIDTEKIDFLQTKESILGHILHKPYGYAGDFEIIDRIYTKNKSKKFQKWDDYFLSNTLAIAIRNRKEYLKNCIKYQLRASKTLNVLIMASGPARIVFEVFEELAHDNFQIKFTCVDLDEQAIAYAKKLNSKYLSHIEFVHKNIFKFTTNDTYDLICSAGLFDYFNDRVFVCMLHKMKKWLRPKGKIIIGNFNKKGNPARICLERWGKWYLHHRSAEKLIKLALDTGFTKENISISNEEENVNLFLHVQR